jgi:GGDEF domain-containing protein
MTRRKHEQATLLPTTRAELRQWIRTRLELADAHEEALCAAIDTVFVQHERLWQESKEEALHAVAHNLTTQMDRLRHQLSARDATVRNIARYFEELVADLTDRVHRDPKTGLATFPWFMARVEAVLRLEQQDRWCAVGLVDIRSFKALNDTFGHAVGDLIIHRVAQLLREHVRLDDIVARQALMDNQTSELHARLGGDEFCFLVSDLTEHTGAARIADRFRRAVEDYDWGAEEPRLRGTTVTVDVGVVCLTLETTAERRDVAHHLGRDLVARADASMYRAKTTRAENVCPLLVRLEHGQLVEFDHRERMAVARRRLRMSEVIFGGPASVTPTGWRSELSPK